MQILRNLQIRIESIHIRYEDDQANPGKPFVVGAVVEFKIWLFICNRILNIKCMCVFYMQMNHLSILTTDADWNPRYIADQVATIHKVCTRFLNNFVILL